MGKSNNISEAYGSQEWIEITLVQNNFPDELDRPGNDDGEQLEETSMELKPLTAMEPKVPTKKRQVSHSKRKSKKRRGSSRA